MTRYNTDKFDLIQLVFQNSALGEENSINHSHSYRSLPSYAAAPPGIILVMNIPGFPTICGFSRPPAILNPSPASPCQTKQRHVILSTKQYHVIPSTKQPNVILSMKQCNIVLSTKQRHVVGLLSTSMTQRHVVLSMRHHVVYEIT